MSGVGQIRTYADEDERSNLIVSADHRDLHSGAPRTMVMRIADVLG